MQEKTIFLSDIITLIGDFFPLILFNLSIADLFLASTPNPYNVSVGYTIIPPSRIAFLALFKAVFDLQLINEGQLIQIVKKYNNCTYSPFEPSDKEVKQAANFQGDKYKLFASIGGSLNRISFFNFDDYENYESLLKIELDNERPIVYRACSDDDSWSYDGCHAWNVDGYDSDNFNSTYFHCNWGWGGNDDGYFSLSCLCPDSIDLHWWDFDIGNFNDDQGAFIGIKPKIEGCMDLDAVNYDESAEISCDNCCDYCEDGTILDIVIVPDNNPDEIEWMLCQNLYGTGLIGADCWFAYGIDEEGSVGDDVCLREPAAYGFAIYDTGFDGICCEDGNGDNEDFFEI